MDEQIKDLFRRSSKGTGPRTRGALRVRHRFGSRPRAPDVEGECLDDFDEDGLLLMWMVDDARSDE